MRAGGKTRWWILPAIIVLAMSVLGAAQTFTRAALVEDVRQLAALIEATHPDPYANGGGKIAFHVRLQKLLGEIPEAGMNRDDFIRILRPFVAGVGDSHTEIWTSYEVDDLRPAGIPFQFRVVEDRLYVAAVTRQEDASYLGSVLVSVEGVPMAELVERQKRLVALENEYHGLEELCSHTLWYGPYLQDLLPEWTDTSKIAFELKRSSGETVHLTADLPVTVRQLYRPSTQFAVPVPGPSGFRVDFLEQMPGASDPAAAIAYLRVDHMTGYREIDEAQGRTSSAPSATETFRDLVIGMAEAGTRTLVVDLRHDGGGDSLMADILVYFLYGKTVLRDVFAHAPRAGGGMVVRLSELYLSSPYTPTLAELNQGRDIPWEVGD
jgi:hypothetical protein